MAALGLATSARAGAALAIGLVAAQARAAFKGARGLGRQGTEAWRGRTRAASARWSPARLRDGGRRRPDGWPRRVSGRRAIMRGAAQT